MNDCCLHLLCPQAVEERAIDLLLARRSTARCPPAGPRSSSSSPRPRSASVRGASSPRGAAASCENPTLPSAASFFGRTTPDPVHHPRLRPRDVPVQRRVRRARRPPREPLEIADEVRLVRVPELRSERGERLAVAGPERPEHVPEPHEPREAPTQDVPRDRWLVIDTSDGTSTVGSSSTSLFKVTTSAAFPVDPRQMLVFDRTPWTPKWGMRFLVPWAGSAVLDATPSMTNGAITTIH